MSGSSAGPETGRPTPAPQPEWTSWPAGSAQWIGVDPDEVGEVEPPTFDDLPGILRDLTPPALLRVSFSVDSPVRSARMAVTARGLYRTQLNGRRVGDDELTPGWTDYRVRIPFQTYDVTELLVPGRNWWSAVVADGWYCGYLGMDRGRQARHYGQRTSFRAHLWIDGDDAGTEVVTDTRWQVAAGAIRAADLLMGQFEDQRLDRPGWELGADHEPWRPASVHPDDPNVQLVPQVGPPIRVAERIRPRSVQRRPDGFVVDFGSNVVGRVRLRVGGQPPGTRIHLRHGEVLDAHGDLHTANLRTARAHDICVRAPGGSDVFEPEFTVHGFRYLHVGGWQGDLGVDDLSAAVLGAELTATGSFDCSDPSVDALHDAVVRTVRGNFLYTPTDCPQRDERLGWLGDAQLIMPTAAFLFDLGGFVDKWLTDIRDGQAADGSYPDVAPRIVVDSPGAPGWADAGVLVPWSVHAHSPDRGRLARHYASMVRYLDSIELANPHRLRERRLGHNYGDWVALDTGTPKPLLATAYWALDADAMAGMAAALGKDADVLRWTQLRADLGRSFAAAFVDADGVVAGGTQTGYALALGADLIPQPLRERSGRLLAQAVQSRDTSVTTGIHGLRHLLPALSDIGRVDLAYALLHRRRHPSWQDMLSRGATTIWERWDGITDRGLGPPAMNSFNHCALGTVAEWLHGYVAGVRRTPGDDPVTVRPYPGGGITWAQARLQIGGAGALRSRWWIDDGRLSLDVDVPPGVVARIAMPTEGDPPAPGGWHVVTVGSGRHRLHGRWTGGWQPTPRLPPRFTRG